MLPAPYQQSSYSNGASFRSRATSFVLALAFSLLLVLMLIKLGAISSLVEVKKPTTLQLLPDEALTQAKVISKTKRASGGASPRKPAPKTPPAGITKAPVVPPPPIPWNVTPLSNDEFAQSDIASKPSHQQAATTNGGDANGSGAGADSGSAYGPGEGPNGERLYNAEWYTRPTNAQLSFYLPSHGTTEGWAIIACQTIERYHVDNCHEVDESPGSGLARALRQAAWQFLVRPPRVGGKPVIGAWVSIRIDWTVDGARLR